MILSKNQSDEKVSAPDTVTDSFSFVIPQFKTGGGNRVFIELANELSRSYPVKVIYPNNSTERNAFIIGSQVAVVPVGNLAFSFVQKIRNFIHCIKYINSSNKQETVIISDPLMCLLIKFIKHKRIVRFVQADDYRIFDDKMILKNEAVLQVYKLLCRLMYREKIEYIFNSKYSYDQYVAVSKNKLPMHIVHPALNPQIFNTKGRQGKDLDKLTVTIMARRHPWKGLSTFIESWGILPETVKKKVNVLLISQDNLEDFRIEGFEVLKPKNDHDIADALRRTEVFISTSWWEGFGLPPLEAMACGCAVILSESGGVWEYALPNKNCLTFKPKDFACLGESLEMLINDNKLRKFLQANSITTAGDFTWKKSASQLLSIINNNP